MAPTRDGTITANEPGRTWGTDMTATVTTGNDTAHISAAVDHYTCECIGLHAAKRGNCFEALKPLRQRLREHFGGLDLHGGHTPIQMRRDPAGGKEEVT